MAEDNPGGEDRGRPRQIKNMQGLFKFCLENTAAEDAPAESHREMSPERREVLNQVLEEMRRDPVQDVKAHLRVVGLFLGASASQEDPVDDQVRSNALESLDQLYDWCESIDMAMDFMKIGGYSVLNELLRHGDAEFRLEGFRLMGLLVQNNPKCQEAAVKDELLPTMLKVLDTERDPEVQTQAVQAISCLVRDRGMESAQQQFVENQGFEVLARVLQCPGPFKRAVKTAFFLSSMCRDNPRYKDMVCRAGLVEPLVQELLKDEHQQSHEHVMDALLVLAVNHPATQSVLKEPHLRMVPFLQARIQLLTGKEENQEERNHAEQLLHILQSSCSASTGSSSRETALMLA